MGVPRFLIDDTADIGEARVFVAHTHFPRFIGELFCDDDDGRSDAPISGVTLAVTNTEILAAIDWIDPPDFDPEELIPALRAALARHWAIRETA